MSEILRFPADFLWGASTSSHQVEGNNEYNDWWKWEAEGKFKESSGIACNQYELFKSDFKLAKSLGHNAHRFSLEWSRIEPEKGKFNQEAIDHYREVIRSLTSMGIKPVVTLNHFTLPEWFQSQGGWIGKGSAKLFAAFAQRAVRSLGKDVTYWLTVNEPVGNIHGAYIEGKYPPGKKSMRDAGRAIVSVLRAHCLAYKAIHRIYKEKNWPTPKVSFAKFTLKYTPSRIGCKSDLLATRIRNYYVNRFFMNALITGWCIAPGIPLARLPLKKSLDFIGLNYYTRDYIHFNGFSKSKILGKICSRTHHYNSGPRNFLEWEIYPRGLYYILMEYAGYNLPILITENGICTNNDFERIDFIKSHLRQVHYAIERGVNIIGYLHWSLTDNFEWAHGYAPRFGLIEVDYRTQKRTVRPSARIYADIIRQNALEI